MATDAETILQAGDLWRLVRDVQDTIGKDGEPLLVGDDGTSPAPLAALRRLADEIDPEYGRY